jgi:AcrR family transcriptional regulator
MRDDATTTRERILAATLDVLGLAGARGLSISEVAATAGVSRPTFYRHFESKDALLDAFGSYEQARFDSGIADATAGLPKAERLEAVLRFMVEFQHSHSLRRMVDIEPEFVLRKTGQVLPITRDRLLRYLPGPHGATIAMIVTRVALSHYLLPDDDPASFLRELRLAAGLAGSAGRRGARARSRPRASTRRDERRPVKRKRRPRRGRCVDHTPVRRISSVSSPWPSTRPRP